MTDNPHEAWTPEHDLAVIYVALAYGTDHDLSDAELKTLSSLLREWREELTNEDVQEIVMEAMSVFLAGQGEEGFTLAVDRLSSLLDDDQRKRALEDVVRIAEADGVLLSSERSLIAVLAERWDVKAEAESLLDQTVALFNEASNWTVFHDIALIYVVLAHSADNELNATEIRAILQRLGDWQPEADEERVRLLLREALEFYAEEPGREALTHSVKALKSLSMIQRLVLIDDLVYIAESDGEITDIEQEIINNLASAWSVSIRLKARSNGHA